jgi:hypothetical protein
MNNKTNNDHRRTAYTMTKNKKNNMTNNEHRRTTYTMTKKQNEQQDKQRSQKDSLDNDQKTK